LIKAGSSTIVGVSNSLSTSEITHVTPTNPTTYTLSARNTQGQTCSESIDLQPSSKVSPPATEPLPLGSTVPAQPAPTEEGSAPILEEQAENVMEAVPEVPPTFPMQPSLTVPQPETSVCYPYLYVSYDSAGSPTLSSNVYLAKACPGIDSNNPSLIMQSMALNSQFGRIDLSTDRKEFALELLYPVGLTLGRTFGITNFEGGPSAPLVLMAKDISLAPAWNSDRTKLVYLINSALGSRMVLVQDPTAFFLSVMTNPFDASKWLPNSEQIISANPSLGILDVRWVRAPGSSLNDHLVYVASVDGNNTDAINGTEIWLYDPVAKVSRRVEGLSLGAWMDSPWVSPDGNRLFFGINGQIGRCDLIQGQAELRCQNYTQMTQAGWNSMPCPTHDGKYLLFSSSRGPESNYEIYMMSADVPEDASHLPQNLTRSPNQDIYPACPVTSGQVL